MPHSLLPSAAHTGTAEQRNSVWPEVSDWPSINAACQKTDLGEESCQIEQRKKRTRASKCTPAERGSDLAGRESSRLLPHPPGSL